MIPQSYDQWRHCIIVECGVALTPEYVEQRLNVWRNEMLQETQRFRHRYGDRHWRAVLEWFERASRELGSR